MPVLALISLSLAPLALLSQKSVAFTQIVNQADPNLRWIPPASVPFGTALGPTQLAAITSTPGVFTYTPSFGVIPPPGVQSLSVTFFPSNANYHGAQVTVPITVTPPGDSGFIASFSPRLPGGNRVFVSPEGEATVQLMITPHGDFHQPITFGCSSQQAIKCIFSPESIRPTTAPLPVTLTLRWSLARREAGLGLAEGGAQGAPQISSVGPANLGTGLHSDIPGNLQLLERSCLTACLLMMAFSRLRHRIERLLHNAPLRSLIAILVLSLFLVSGCGDSPSTTESLIISAHSLVDSQSLPVELVQLRR